MKKQTKKNSHECVFKQLKNGILICGCGNKLINAEIIESTNKIILINLSSDNPLSVNKFNIKILELMKEFFDSRINNNGYIVKKTEIIGYGNRALRLEIVG